LGYRFTQADLSKARVPLLVFLVLALLPLGMIHAASQANRFDVMEYRVSGNSLLDVKDVEMVLYSHLGKGKTFDDVEVARRDLQNHYREAGYPAVLVDIPEQSVSDGVVWLRVTESRVSRLRISGSRYYSPRQLAEDIPSLQVGKRLKLSQVQEEIGKAGSAYPERMIIPVLRPGDTPGTVEVELKVKDESPLHGGIEIHDRYSLNTSRWRTNVSLSYTNLWQMGHSLGLQYQTAPEEPEEVKVLSGTYSFRLSESNSIVALYGVDSESNTAAIGDITVVGNGSIYGARWIKPWRGSEHTSHILSLGSEYKDFKDDLVLQGADRESTPIKYMTLNISFSTTYKVEKVLTGFNVSATYGVRGVGSSREEFVYKRYLAQQNFLYLKAGVNHSRPLFFGDSLHLSLDGQLANSPLISNEQFAAGGSETVRGYHESQILGDDGVIARIEWHSPSMLGAGEKAKRELYALIFWDSALLHTQDALEDQESQSDLSSAGFGLRFTQGSSWDARLDWAQVFETADSVDKGDSRWHIYFNYAF
jgi:hemolysin activation/secretion protein